MNIPNIANLLISSLSFDAVGVFAQDSFVPLFSDARAIKAKVNESATVMTHPVEDGTIITDHRVINPITIELSLMVTSITYRSTYETIKNLFLNSTFLSVQTKSSTYKNMMISAMPHDEDPEIFGGILIALSLTEVKIATFTTGEAPKSSAPKDAKKTATKNTGKKQATTASATTSTNATKKITTQKKESSVLYGVFN